MGTNHQKVAINEGDNASLPLFVPSHEFDNGGNDLLVYQFSDPIPSCDVISGTQPLSFFYKDKELPLDGKWRSLFYRMCDVLAEINVEKLKQTAQKFTAKYFSLSNEGMIAPKLHPSEVWIDQNVSARGSVRYSRRLADEFGIPLEDFKVTFSKKQLPIIANKNDALKDVKRDAARYKRDILRFYVNGFDFSENAKRLIEARQGGHFSSNATRFLKSQMFDCKSRLWFFPEQIIAQHVQEDILATCFKLIANHSFVVLTQVASLLNGVALNLDSTSDEIRFIEFLIRNSSHAKNYDFAGRQSGRICFSSDAGAENIKKEFADKVRTFLRERFDAVTIVELLDNFPMVTADWMIDNLPELIPDAILEDLGNQNLAFKLLEFYYLPDDFSSVFHSVTNDIVANDGVLSVSTILNELDGYYNCDFKEDFALSESTFKQIATYVDQSHREWHGAIFGKADGDECVNLTFAQIVEDQFPCIFSHEEFYQFGAITWGWGEQHRMWHHQRLWNTFIRYDAEHWSSVDYFKTATGWNETIELQITEMLLSLLGSAFFFSLNKVPQSFLDSLPELSIDGMPVCWTIELLASVAYFCLSSVRVLNHAEHSFVVSSLLVPMSVPSGTDGIEYMVRMFKLRNPIVDSGEGGFAKYQDRLVDFLIENNIRQRASKKLYDTVGYFLRMLGA